MLWLLYHRGVYYNQEQEFAQGEKSNSFSGACGVRGYACRRDVSVARSSPEVKKDSPEPPKAVLITLPVRRATGMMLAVEGC